MGLEFKPDFEKVLERFEAWWHCGLVDRALVSLHAISGRAPRLPEKQHASLRERWLDVEYAVGCAEAYLAAADFMGDAIPSYMPNVGPEVCAALYGCELQFEEGTSWSEPILKEVRETLGRAPDLDNVYWQALRDMTDLSIERGKDRWLTGIPDIHMNGDLLAALRDPQELCMDVAVVPGDVREACDYVTNHFPAIYDDMYHRIEAAGLPSISWIQAPHQGRMSPTQCDFICMISPDSFEQTILPGLKREFAYLDRTVYHLDGPGALRHLDLLLACDDLNGVQWVYGAGNGSAKDWIEVYQRIQAGGKCMQILCADISDARAVMEHIGPRGAWFDVGGAYPREEAEAFLEEVSRWTAEKG